MHKKILISKMQKGKLINTTTQLISTLEFYFILLKTNNFNHEDIANLTYTLQSLQYISPDNKWIKGLYNPIPHMTSIKTHKDVPLYITFVCYLAGDVLKQTRKELFKYLNKYSYSYDNIIPCKKQPESKLPLHHRAMIKIINNRMPKIYELIALHYTLKKERNYKKQEFDTHIKNIMFAECLKKKGRPLQRLRNYIITPILYTLSGNLLSVFKHKYGSNSAIYKLTEEHP